MPPWLVQYNLPFPFLPRIFEKTGNCLKARNISLEWLTILHIPSGDINEVYMVRRGPRNMTWWRDNFSGGGERLFIPLSFILGCGRRLWVWLWQALALLWLSRMGFKYGKILR